MMKTDTFEIKIKGNIFYLNQTISFIIKLKLTKNTIIYFHINQVKSFTCVYKILVHNFI